MRSLLIAGILTVSLIAIGMVSFLHPFDRTSTKSRADSGGVVFTLSDQSVTPVESQFSQFLYGPTQPPVKVSPMPQFPVSPTPVLGKPVLTAVLGYDKKNVQLQFSNLAGVLRITYAATYIAKDGAKGATGTIDILPGTTTIQRDVALGTCSKNVCTYDDVQSAISVQAIFKMLDGTEVTAVQSVQYSPFSLF